MKAQLHDTEAILVPKAETALRDCLGTVPFLFVEQVDTAPRVEPARPDLIATVTWPEGVLLLVAEVKQSVSPRLAREVVLPQLRRSRATIPGSYGILIAHYISPQVAGILEREGFGHVDLAGNCLIAFGYLYVRREGRPNIHAEKRALRSLYSPKAERVLRVLLHQPGQRWKLTELAEEADVSLGQVHKVKELLVDQEWMSSTVDGFRLLEPERLLKDWAANYRSQRTRRYDYYSLKRLPEIESAIAEHFTREGKPYALTGFSGAARLAPFVRYQRVHAYVGAGRERFAESLGAREVPSGPNLTLLEPYDEGVFYGSAAHEGIQVASPAQLYLDLQALPGRGEEAAEFLFDQVITKQWQPEKTILKKG